MKVIYLLFLLIITPSISIGQLTEPPKLDASTFSYSYSDYMNNHRSIKLNTLKMESPKPMSTDEYWELYYSQAFKEAPASTNLLQGQDYNLYNPSGANSFGEALIGGTLNYLLQLGR